MLISKNFKGEVVLIDKITKLIRKESNNYRSLSIIRLESQILVRFNFIPKIKLGDVIKIWGVMEGDVLVGYDYQILNSQRKLNEFYNNHALGNTDK